MLIPGYTLLKFSVDEAIDDVLDYWKAVLVAVEDNFNFGIEMDWHVDGYSTIFSPEHRRPNLGI